MKRRFIVIINDASNTEQDVVTAHFRGVPGIGFWHWFSDVWLIVDTTNKLNAENLRNRLNELLPNSHKIVINAENVNNWAAYGRTENFQWFRDEWDK